jgi:hypothetical protein
MKHIMIQWIVITFQLNQIPRLFFLSRHNDSQIVITVQSENSFFSYFRRSILKGSPLSLTIIWSFQLNYYPKELTSHILSEWDKPRDRNTQLGKSLLKPNLASLYPNLILCDLLIIYFLSCCAHFSWAVVLTFLECVVTHFLFWVYCH